MALKETTWLNPRTTSLAEGLPYVRLAKADVDDAHARLNRFAPYLAKASGNRGSWAGLSNLSWLLFGHEKRLERESGKALPGTLLLKKTVICPSPARLKRGGIYAVLTHAENWRWKRDCWSTEDDYSILEPRFKDFFSQYSIAVGSTGNLGMSIGIMSARIGFKVTVHMSADAREWKKAKPRSHGVTVVEYEQDYGVAVEQGRKAAENDRTFFIDR